MHVTAGVTAGHACDRRRACSWFLAQAGVVSIMELLQQPNRSVAEAALELLLAVVADDAPVLESLCLVGLVPIVARLSGPSHAQPLRARAARFLLLLCTTSAHTVQMFLACGGLAVLVQVPSPPPPPPTHPIQCQCGVRASSSHV